MTEITRQQMDDLDSLIKYACGNASYYGIGPYVDHDPQSKEQRDKWRSIAKTLMAYDVLLKKVFLAALQQQEHGVADVAIPPADYFFENDNWDITYHRGEHEDEAMENAHPNEIVEFHLLKDVGSFFMVNHMDAEGNSEIKEYATAELAKAALSAAKDGAG